MEIRFSGFFAYKQTEAPRGATLEVLQKHLDETYDLPLGVAKSQGDWVTLTVPNEADGLTRKRLELDQVVFQHAPLSERANALLRLKGPEYLYHKDWSTINRADAAIAEEWHAFGRGLKL